jgi:xanthine dehydrogenase accessory factor
LANGLLGNGSTILTELNADTSYDQSPKVGMVTDDDYEILRFAADAADSGLGSALVTLVDIRGGAARALGAQMAVRGDGLYCGYVSGGCTEAAIAAEARATITAGFDRYLQLGEGSRFFDIVLPCGGGITVSIHVVRESASLRNALSQLDLRTRTSLTYDPSDQSLHKTPYEAPSGWHLERFVRSYRPKPRILLFGGTIEVQATSQIAKAAGYEVHMDVDLRGAHSDQSAIDDDTAVVILHHDIDKELPTLQAALAAKPFYIGALGSRRTHERRAAALLALGYDNEQIARIKAPIGLFGKARDSGSLALSVLADIAAIRSTSTT